MGKKTFWSFKLILKILPQKKLSEIYSEELEKQKPKIPRKILALITEYEDEVKQDQGKQGKSKIKIDGSKIQTST